MMMNTCKKGKAQQSQTELPRKNPHQNQQEEDHKCEGTSEDQNPINVPYLPSPIVSEILSRVRIKTIFNCRLVCKSWADLISTPEFAQLHLSRSPTSCLIKPLKKHHSKRLHLVDLEYPYSPTNKIVFVPEINLTSVPIWLTNSCNGLVCFFLLFSHDSTDIYVCNPILREYITLPKPSHGKEIRTYGCAFGFSHKTNQYKVILSSYNRSSGNFQAEIYTLGEGSWRSIVNAPYYFRYWDQCFNASVDGAFHWLTYSVSYPFICCFDFVTEQFRSVPEPSEFGSLERELCQEMKVGVINGNLSICDYGKGDHIDIWVMKDYGVKESWSKHIVINHVINKSEYDTYEQIMITDSGEVLVIFNKDSIMLYDHKSQQFECDLEILGFVSAFHAIAHVPSLISLKDVAKGENLKVLGRN